MWHVSAIDESQVQPEKFKVCEEETPDVIFTIIQTWFASGIEHQNHFNSGGWRQKDDGSRCLSLWLVHPFTYLFNYFSGWEKFIGVHSDQWSEERKMNLKKNRLRFFNSSVWLKHFLNCIGNNFLCNKLHDRMICLLPFCHFNIFFSFFSAICCKRCTIGDFSIDHRLAFFTLLKRVDWIYCVSWGKINWNKLFHSQIPLSNFNFYCFFGYFGREMEKIPGGRPSTRQLRILYI